jgi:hypothetical protein
MDYRNEPTINKSVVIVGDVREKIKKNQGLCKKKIHFQIINSNITCPLSVCKQKCGRGKYPSGRCARATLYELRADRASNNDSRAVWSTAVFYSIQAFFFRSTSFFPRCCGVVVLTGCLCLSLSAWLSALGPEPQASAAAYMSTCGVEQMAVWHHLRDSLVSEE